MVDLFVHYFIDVTRFLSTLICNTCMPERIHYPVDTSKYMCM